MVELLSPNNGPTGNAADFGGGMGLRVTVRERIGLLRGLAAFPVAKRRCRRRNNAYDDRSNNSATKRVFRSRFELLSTPAVPPVMELASSYTFTVSPASRGPSNLSGHTTVDWALADARTRESRLMLFLALLLLDRWKTTDLAPSRHFAQAPFCGDPPIWRAGDSHSVRSPSMTPSLH